ncbi:MAG: right-handed parallel beta-helix repeat-containing protein [Isosphaeraceae bacterium]
MFAASARNVALFAFGLGLATAEGAEWLDVRDCGASGSKFETNAETTDGSKEITVADVGDFKVGQGVMVSKCNIRFTPTRLWGTGEPYRNSKKLEGSVEVRNYDGSGGSWAVYVVDIAASDSPAFRWSDDLGRTWQPEVAINHDWQPLSSGVEIKFNTRDWESGYVAAFGARDQLVTRIEKIEGNVLTLTDAANRTIKDAVIRHNDTIAIQAAVDQGLKENRKVYLPVGHYRLAHSIRINNASAFTMEGASSVDTLLDISDGEGTCLTLSDGKDVTIRNLRMLGFMGFDERDKAGYINTKGSVYIWGFGLKPCNAVTISGTERVLVENCHASKMSGECFVSGGPSRGTVKPGRSYSQGITYLRCSVTDSARNAFNDVLCGTENTSVLQCRIVDVGGCAWEGASRFVKFVGNYVRNSGTVAMGNLGPANRDETFPDLGAGQHLVADNVFESNVPYGQCAIRSNVGATQVIIRNNLFVNFNSSAVEASGATGPRHYPAGNTIISGNHFDMTCVGQESKSRTAINISANDTTVSDNQIYVRGSVDSKVTGIQVAEPALNLNIHDNLIRDCGPGVATRRGDSRVEDVKDDRTFTRSSPQFGLPLDRVRPWMCQGWRLAWLPDKVKPSGDVSVIESFDPETLQFTLREPRPMKPGDRFEVIAPRVNWNIHDNQIIGCLQPVVLGGYGSETSRFQNNLVVRGATTGVKAAVEIRGRFNLIGNQFNGFDEKEAATLSIWPDRFDKPSRSMYRNNILEQCSNAVAESAPGLWAAAITKDNEFIDCEGVPEAGK